MSNALIGYQNAVKTSTVVSYSTAAPGLDPSQLQSNEAGAASMAWQTSGSTSAVILFDAGAQTQQWSCLVVARTNLTALAQVAVKVWLDAAQTTLVANIGPVTPTVVGGLLVYLFPATYAGQRCQVTITDGTNANGYLNIPLMYLGPLFAPIGNITTASTNGRDARVDAIVTRSGVEFPQFRWQRRRLSADFQSIRASEMTTYQAIDFFSRTGANLLFVPDKTSATIQADSIYGLLTAKADFGYPFASPDRRSWKADLTERL